MCSGVAAGLACSPAQQEWMPDFSCTVSCLLGSDGPVSGLSFLFFQQEAPLCALVHSVNLLCDCIFCLYKEKQILDVANMH